MYSISEIVEYAKARGLLSLFRAGVKKLVLQHDKYILLSLSLEDPIPEIQPLHNITIRKAALADVRGLHQSMTKHNWWRSKKRLSEWIAKDYPFFLAIAEDKIVGCACVALDAPGRDPALLKAVNFKDDDAWGEDAFVLPTYRGNRICPALLTETMKWAKAAGYRRIFTVTSPDNLSSKACQKKVGYKEIKEVTFFRILLFKRTNIKEPVTKEESARIWSS